MHDARTEPGYAALKDIILARQPPQYRRPAFASHPFAEAAAAVYRNNVRAAYYRVLRDTFPVVHRLVGDDFFRAMAQDYFYSNLPVSRLVSAYGYALPAFIEAYPPCAALPYLADVARFEFLWLQSYHAADAVSLPIEAIERRLAVDPEGSRIRLHSSTRLFGSAYPVVDVWLNNRLDHPEPMRIEKSAAFTLIARPEQDVRIQKVSRAAFNVLHSLADGKRLGEAFDDCNDDSEDPTTILQQIFAAGIITDISSS